MLCWPGLKIVRLVKHLVISASSKKIASQFETVMDVQVDEKDGKLQVSSFNMNDVPAHFLNFQVANGWDNFVAISRIIIEGELSEASLWN